MRAFVISQLTQYICQGLMYLRLKTDWQNSYAHVNRWTTLEVVLLATWSPSLRVELWCRRSRSLPSGDVSLFSITEQLTLTSCCWQALALRVTFRVMLITLQGLEYSRVGLSNCYRPPTSRKQGMSPMANQINVFKASSPLYIFHIFLEV